LPRKRPREKEFHQKKAKGGENERGGGRERRGRMTRNVGRVRKEGEAKTVM